MIDGLSSEYGVQHWDAYNARNLEDDEIADRFYPPPYFRSLLAPQHQLIVGPRGSGKTTLLRMLQRSTLARWSHSDAAFARSTISFEGIFIPADPSWGAQFQDAVAPRLATDLEQSIADATFTAHALRSLLRTVSFLKQPQLADGGSLVLTRNHEEEVCALLGNAWHLDAGIPSIKGLRRALMLRLTWLGRLRRRASRGSLSTSEFRDMPWVDLDTLDEIAFATEQFDEVRGIEPGRWALLFDELEVAPRAIRASLMGSLRVPHTRILLKLALSPYPGTAGQVPTGHTVPSVPREANDYDVVSLTHSDRVDIERFGKPLLDGLVGAATGGEATALDVFGRSRVATPAANWLLSGTAYGPGHKRVKEIARYMKSDPSVTSYLEHHGIDIDRIGETPPGQRAAHLRKIAPLIALREYYTVPSVDPSSRRTFRTRNTLAFYSGIDMLLAMSEGHPRTMMNLFRPMIERAAAQPDSKNQVPTNVQADVVQEQIASFRTLLKTIPGPALRGASLAAANASSRGLLELLDAIGGAFSDVVYARDFSADPPASFIVDSHLGPGVLQAIQAAVNVGALIFVPDADGVDYFGSPRGKRLRLCYLLAAHYRLPLRLGRAVSLSNILKAGVSESARSPAPKRRDAGPTLFEL